MGNVNSFYTFSDILYNMTRTDLKKRQVQGIVYHIPPELELTTENAFLCNRKLYINSHVLENVGVNLKMMNCRRMWSGGEEYSHCYYYI